MCKSLYKPLVHWLVFNWNTQGKKDIPVEDRGGGAGDDDTKKEKIILLMNTSLLDH